MKKRVLCCFFLIAFTIWGGSISKVKFKEPGTNDLVKGKWITITWFSSGLPPFHLVNIYLLSGNSSIPIKTGVTSRNGTNEFRWRIPWNVPEGSYSIKIVYASNERIFGKSQSFSIVKDYKVTIKLPYDYNPPGGFCCFLYPSVATPGSTGRVKAFFYGRPFPRRGFWVRFLYKIYKTNDKCVLPHQAKDIFKNDNSGWRLLTHRLYVFRNYRSSYNINLRLPSSPEVCGRYGAPNKTGFIALRADAGLFPSKTLSRQYSVTCTCYRRVLKVLGPRNNSTVRATSVVMVQWKEDPQSTNAPNIDGYALIAYGFHKSNMKKIVVPFIRHSQRIIIPALPSNVRERTLHLIVAWINNPNIDHVPQNIRDAALFGPVAFKEILLKVRHR